MSRLPPSFGQFQPVRRLGAGGMAETFVAIRRGPGEFEQRVCIKRILPAYESDREFVDSFLREAKTSAALRHGNIVQVLDFGLEDGAHYLALELIDGVDLRALIGNDRERGRLDAELAILVTAEVGAALEHAHAKEQDRPQVIHRDISPSNVLLSRAGEVKLTDFGIARAVGDSHRTATGVIKGKLPYLPPEYVDGKAFTERGDLFSLGVMLYELLSGRRPFDGESDLDTIRRISVGAYTPLRELAPDTPETLLACVERLLAVDPNARFGSARDLLEALPAIATHKVRRRLADMVRARASEEPQPADPLAGTLASPSQAPGPANAPGTQPSRHVVTRTATKPLRAGLGRPSPRAIAALAAASTGLLVVLGIALLRPNDPLAPNAVVQRQPVAVPSLEPKQAPREQPTAASPAPPVESPPTAVPTATSTDASVAPIATQPHAPVREQAELRVFVHPFGDVWVDGKALGQAPIVAKLSPGTHIVAVGDGRPGEKHTVRLTAGERERLEIQRRMGEHN